MTRFQISVRDLGGLRRLDRTSWSTEKVRLRSPEGTEGQSAGRVVRSRDWHPGLYPAVPSGLRRRIPAHVAISELMSVRSLDALHLAAASRLGPSVVELLTFDIRQAQAARQLHFDVLGV